MTRTEAREWFKNALNNNDFFPETEDAFKIAIEALSDNAPSISIDKRELCEDINCEDCPFMQDTCKLLEVFKEFYEQGKYDATITKAEPKWIPVSERLPKTGEQVLCCDNQSRVFTSALTEIASNGMTFFGKHCKVVAWMPLPEPYRVESEA